MKSPAEQGMLFLRLLAELKSAGVNVSALGVLMSMRPMPAQAVPVLVRHLDLPHEPGVTSMLARCLADPAARNLGLFRRFLEMFTAIPESDSADARVLKESLLLAASYHATKQEMPLLLGAVEATGQMNYLGYVIDRIRQLRFVPAAPLVLRAAEAFEGTEVYVKALGALEYVEALPALSGLARRARGKRLRVIEEVMAKLKDVKRRRASEDRPT